MNTLVKTGGFEDDDEGYVSMEQMLEKLEKERMRRLGIEWWEDD